MNFENTLRNYCEDAVYFIADVVVFKDKVYQLKNSELNKYGVIGTNPDDEKHWEKLGFLGKYEVEKMIYRFNQIENGKE